MKLYWTGMLVGFLVLGTGCSALVPKFYTNSNIIAVTRQIEALSFTEITESVRPNSKVTIKNMELGPDDMELSGPYSLDSTIHYVLEQKMTERFLKEGIIVLERDPHILTASMTERGKSYTFKVANPAAADDEVKGSEGGGGGGDDNDETDVDVTIVNEAPDGNGDNSRYSKSSRTRVIKSPAPPAAKEKEYVPPYLDLSTGFSTSDYIVGYRVLDCGVYTQPSPIDKITTIRVAKCAVHVRVSSTKSSVIVYAGTLERLAEDAIMAPAYDGHIQVVFDPADFTHPDKSDGKKKSSGPSLLPIPEGIFGF